MPFKGLSKFRLKEHFRKFTAFYLVGALICILVTNLVYTSTRYRTPAEEEVLVYLVDPYTSASVLDPLAAEALEYGITADELLEVVRFESIMYNDPQTDYNSAILLMARMAVGDGDAYISSKIAAENMIRMEMAYPLDEALANGWMDGLGLEPIYHTSEETGQTYVAALSMENVEALKQTGMNTEDAALFIAGNGTNIDTTLQVVEYIITELVEGYDASAASAQPET